MFANNWSHKYLTGHKQVTECGFWGEERRHRDIGRVSLSRKLCQYDNILNLKPTKGASLLFLLIPVACFQSAAVDDKSLIHEA